MSLRSLPLLSLLAALPAAAWADAPQVMTDFGPTHSIVTTLMQGVGTPDVLLAPGDDPHDFTLRPSQARTLSQADLVIWVGASLTPWLVDPLENLAGDAAHLSLLETEGWNLLPFRDLDEAMGHDDHAEHGDHDDHEDHGEHAEHGDHDDHEGHDDHAEHDDHDDHAGHDHGEFDPHAWLAPTVVSVWADAVAQALIAQDAENAEQYAANLAAFQTDLTTLSAELAAIATQIDGTQIILPHDSFQYFEVGVGLTPAGFISNSEDADPGPGHLRELREMVEAGDVACVLHESPTDAEWAAVLIENTAAQTAMVDATDRAGVGYIAMMTNLATTLRDCAN